MLTIYNWNTSPIELKTSVLPLDKGIANFQFAFTGQQYLLLYRPNYRILSHTHFRMKRFSICAVLLTNFAQFDEQFGRNCRTNWAILLF